MAMQSSCVLESLFRVHCCATGSVYVCGETQDIPVPSTAAQVCWCSRKGFAKGTHPGAVCNVLQVLMLGVLYKRLSKERVLIPIYEGQSITQPGDIGQGYG